MTHETSSDGSNRRREPLVLMPGDSSSGQPVGTGAEQPMAQRRADLEWRGESTASELAEPPQVPDLADLLLRAARRRLAGSSQPETQVAQAAHHEAVTAQPTPPVPCVASEPAAIRPRRPAGRIPWASRSLPAAPVDTAPRVDSTPHIDLRDGRRRVEIVIPLSEAPIAPTSTPDISRPVGAVSTTRSLPRLSGPGVASTATIDLPFATDPVSGPWGDGVDTVEVDLDAEQARGADDAAPMGRRSSRSHLARLGRAFSRRGRSDDRASGSAPVHPCPSCGIEGSIDIADQQLGEIYLSCRGCFSMWQAPSPRSG